MIIELFNKNCIFEKSKLINMETTTILENFNINCIAWHEVEDKIDVWTIGKLLNKQIDLSKYSSDLHQIQFQYIADYSTDFHEEEMAYNPDDKTIFLSLRLDYDKVKDGTNEEVLILMKDLFLTSVFYYFSVGVRDFDFRGFYEDLKAIFEA
jgi:hypothetical protein